MRSLRLGTRGSALALTQSGHVADALRRLGATVELVTIRTRGDELRDLSLQANLDKGFFTTEIEAALRDDAIDVAVHSLKDLPTAATPGLVVGAIPTREAAGDVLLVRSDVVGEPLRPGARVGTSAARRVALLAAWAPDATAVPLRGNLPTRLAAPASGDLDAIVLARAGLTRLGAPPHGLTAFDLDPTRFIPAPGQGALAVQCRADDASVLALLRLHNDARSAHSVRLERGVLARMEGGCHAAVGAWVSPDGVLHAGALLDGAWRAVAVPVGPDADAHAVDALLAGPPPPEPGPWAVPAEPWC